MPLSSRAALFCAALALAPAPAALAQTWEGDPAVTRQLLTAFGLDPAGDGDSHFFAAEGEALGVLYTPIPGAAGNMDITVGYFTRDGGAFRLAGRVEGLFGTAPRAPRFGPGDLGLTTTTLAPGDPRCCPTGTTAWVIDRASLRAQPR